VTNFNPTDTPVVGLSPDGSGGLWFGAGPNLDHIDRDGRIETYPISREWLWSVSGVAIDPHGRRWYSLGQSGRIATLDGHRRVRTQVLVPRRYFPDIRDLVFDARGTLWFVDSGRSSLGRRTAQGVVREKPFSADVTIHGLVRCGNAIWVTTSRNRESTIFTIPGDLQSLRAARTWNDYRYISIACDANGTLWYSAMRTERTTIGTIDPDGRSREFAESLDGAFVQSGADGSIYLTGEQTGREHCACSTAARLAIFRPHGDHFSATTLPILSWTEVAFASARNGTLWLAVRDPWSVVRMVPVP
jgi:streptogramin lyase